MQPAPARPSQAPAELFASRVMGGLVLVLGLRLGLVLVLVLGLGLGLVLGFQTFAAVKMCWMMLSSEAKQVSNREETQHNTVSKHNTTKHKHNTIKHNTIKHNTMKHNTTQHNTT